MEDISIIAIKDGDPTRYQGIEAPSKGDLSKPKFEGNVKKKRRRGKFKRKLIKPFAAAPWQERWKKDKPKRNNRYRKVVLATTHAPFNNNQFLMEIHKPEPENNFNIMQTPSARTRDSSFSMDSEDNYFYSLPEDEEEYLTKEFSSVYEDAQTERLASMSKNELIQEYLLLEAKYENLVKRTERSKIKPVDESSIASDKETSVTDKESVITDRDTSETSIKISTSDDSCLDLVRRMKEQEELLNELRLTNEKLRLENEHLHHRSQASSSADSESDSSSSDSASSSSSSVVDEPIEEIDNNVNGECHHVHANGQHEETDEPVPPLVNGFHSPNE